MPYNMHPNNYASIENMVPSKVIHIFHNDEQRILYKIQAITNELYCGLKKNTFILFYINIIALRKRDCFLSQLRCISQKAMCPNYLHSYFQDLVYHPFARVLLLSHLLSSFMARMFCSGISVRLGCRQSEVALRRVYLNETELTASLSITPNVHVCREGRS